MARRYFWFVLLSIVLLGLGGGIWYLHRSRSVRPTTVTVYYLNRAYVETGNERLPHLLAEKKRLAPAPGEGLAAAAVRALQTKPSSSGAIQVIRHDLQVRRVWVHKGVAYVDFARTNLAGGSLEEMLLVEGTVKTLTGLPGITAVQFLVEGRPAETLMGHVAVDRPFKAEDIP